MPETTDRCSIRSEAAHEPVLATASTVRNWLLLEHPGPWGVQALRDARMPPGLGARLRTLGREHRFRTLLIRRPIRDPDPRTSCFAIHSGPGDPWVERVDLNDLVDACDLDLAALGRGERPGLTPHTDPLFAVCTHGRHDACCAERGRPLARSLAEAFPAQTWESSHIGGDRFAGNLLAFPHGMYFGRVTADRGPLVAASYLEGRIDLTVFRGRSCRSVDAQAAEHFLRAKFFLEGVDEVVPEHIDRSGDEITVVARTYAGSYDVRLLRGEGPEERLTCHSTAPQRPPTFRLLGIDRRA
ncbi:MAG: sucrase ferredoxin [Actinomycetota bacterium]